MKNVIFVHGIGTRQPAYGKSFDKIKKNLVDRLGEGNVSLHECYWGGPEGSKLHADGASVPKDSSESTRAPSQIPSDEEYDLALWELLYQDPFYELRLYISQQHSTEEVAPGQKSAGKVILQKLESLALPNQLIAEAELEEVFDEARRKVINKSGLREVAGKVSKEEAYAFGEVLARAIVAKAIDLYGEDSGLCEAATNAALRDKLVDALTTDAEESTRGLSSTRGPLDWTKNQLEGLALNKLTNHLKSKRDANKESFFAAPGDLLLYQVRGQDIREFIASKIEAINEPVVVIGHSLGGVASVDLLIEREMNVDLLITVGSQAPFFYEINALHSLSFEKGGRNPQLPAHFPKKWWNFYDQRDFLSYVGNGIFGNVMEDVEVDNKQPFPRSHISYWSNDTMWAKIVEVLQTP